jgi:hypothetical protein
VERRGEMKGWREEEGQEGKERRGGEKGRREREGEKGPEGRQRKEGEEGREGEKGVVGGEVKKGGWKDREEDRAVVCACACMSVYPPPLTCDILYLGYGSHHIRMGQAVGPAPRVGAGAGLGQHTASLSVLRGETWVKGQYRL